MAEVDGELAAVVRARVGTTLCGGKYTIDGVLGIGGMAAVYSGTHRNGRPIAIKLLHPDLSRQPNIRRRFLREGQAANAVQHPGVVAVIDDDVAEDGAAFVVMERLEGNTLDELWEELGRCFPPRAVLAIGRELCEILAAAHRSGIIHRDLKPENLFLTNDGELKVLDFGLAQLRDAARSPTETQTGMGLVLGTPAFMPPEQASGENSKIDARTDVWAVGATMFTLLSGQHVHDGETPQHFVMLAATEPARSLAAAMPAAPAALVAVVDRALAREKEQRWQSAESMREAIVSVSELLLGEPAPPLMTPLALQEAAPPQRAETSPQAASYFEDLTLDGVKVTPVADLTDETLDDYHPDDHTVTERARAAPRPSDDSSDSSEDRTRVGVPDFTLSSDGSDTEPNVAATARAVLEKLPRLGGGSGSSDASSEDSSEDDAMQVRPVSASSPAPPTEKRASWSDLRHAVEQTESSDSREGSDETSTRTERQQAPIEEPSSDRIQKLRSGVRPSAHHRVAHPPAPSRASRAIPPDRASSPAPVPVPRTAETTIRAPRPRAGTIPYLRIVLAAIFVAVSPVLYFAARGCGGVAPPEEQTLPLTAPSSLPSTPAITSPSSPRVFPPTSQITPEPAPTSNVAASNSSAASAAPRTSTSPRLVVPPDPNPPASSPPAAGSDSLPEAPDSGKETPSP